MNLDFGVTNVFREAMSRRHEPEGVRILSNIYWRTLVLVEILIVGLAIAYGIWGLLRVLSDLGAISAASAPPPSALNRGVLDATVSGFEKRQAQFDLLKSSRGEPIADPSR